MIFYRGITVEESRINDIIQKIKTNGILGDEGKIYFIHNIKEEISSLLENPNLCSEITRPSKRIEFKGGFTTEYIDSENCVCCSSDINTAAYYSNIHNKNKKHSIPLIIKFEIPIKDVYIDGRDFLYYAFTENNIEKILPILQDIYGSKISDYYRKAIEKENLDYRYSIVDLACQDEDIIQYHFNNNKVIKGRYNVLFKSSFMVKAPINPEQILDIFDSDYIPPSNIDYSISNL